MELNQNQLQCAALKGRHPAEDFINQFPFHSVLCVLCASVVQKLSL